MLQPFANQTDIPEALREHYSKREDGKWHADISDDHPAVKHNAKLLSEKTQAEGKVTQLTSDLESARAGNLGRGQVAVAKSEAALLDEYKPLGTPAELTTKLAQAKTDGEELSTRKRNDSLRQVSKALEFNEEAFTRLPNLPEFISRAGKDGKTLDWFAQVKDDKGVVTEKPAKEFIESNPDLAPFMPSLKATARTVQVHGSTSTVVPTEGDPHAWAKGYAKNYIDQSQPVADPFKAFSERSSSI